MLLSDKYWDYIDTPARAEFLEGSTASGKTTTVSSNATAINANTYVVQPGDNLWKIAKKVYGQGFVWRKIFDANSNVVSNPGNIHVGQVLLIP